MRLFKSNSYTEVYIKNNILKILIMLQYVRFETLFLTYLINKSIILILSSLGFTIIIPLKIHNKILIKVAESQLVNKRRVKNKQKKDDLFWASHWFWSQKDIKHSLSLIVINSNISSISLTMTKKINTYKVWIREMRVYFKKCLVHSSMFKEESGKMN